MATTEAEPRAFPTEKVEALLGMSREMVRYHIRLGHIRAVRIGRRYFVPAVEIERILKDGGGA